MRPRIVAVAVACALASLVGCSGDNEPVSSRSPTESPSQANSPTAEPTTELPDAVAARKLLDRLRRSTFKANTGSYSITADLGAGGVTGSGSYRLEPYGGTADFELSGPDGSIRMEAYAKARRAWYRIYGAGGNPAPTCWVHARFSEIAELQGFSEVGRVLGVSPVIAALDRAVSPVWVDSDTLRVRADLHNIAASVPGKLVTNLRIPLESEDKVDIELDVEGGEFRGWSARLGDIVQVAFDAGYPDQSELPPAFADFMSESEFEVQVEVRDLGEPVAIDPPTRDIVELTLDDREGFERAWQACSDA